MFKWHSRLFKPKSRRKKVIIAKALLVKAMEKGKLERVWEECSDRILKRGVKRKDECYEKAAKKICRKMGKAKKNIKL